MSTQDDKNEDVLANMAPSDNNNRKLLDVRGLAVEFLQPRTFCVLDRVSLAIAPGETVGLVGESGAGKTTLGLAILGLLPSEGRISSGQILWQGNDLLVAGRRGFAEIRGRGATMIFQDPKASLNPVYRIGTQMRWLLTDHYSLNSSAARARVIELLSEVRFDDPSAVMNKYPHQLSGGMCQRVMIAKAIALQPLLLVADEPTGGLDVTTQAELLGLMKRLTRIHKMAMLFISHNFAVIAQIADRVAVMYKGQIVESNSVRDFYNGPQSDQGRRLLAAVPTIERAMCDSSADCSHNRTDSTTSSCATDDELE